MYSAVIRPADAMVHHVGELEIDFVAGIHRALRGRNDRAWVVNQQANRTAAARDLRRRQGGNGLGIEAGPGEHDIRATTAADPRTDPHAIIEIHSDAADVAKRNRAGTADAVLLCCT